MRLKLCHALVFLIALCVGESAFAGDWADPTGFFEEEKIEVQELSPGLTWIAASGELNGRPLRTHIVAVDLAQSHLSLQTLLGERFAGKGQFFRRSPTSQLQEDGDARVAINVSFFDIGATQAPQGLVLREGKIVREPNPHRPNFVFLPDGRAAITNFGWKAKLRIRSDEKPLTGVNRPALGQDEIVLFRPPWSLSPGNSADFTKDRSVKELLLEETSFQPAATPSDRARLTGRVLEIREKQGSVKIQDDQFVLTASEEATGFFRNAGVGTEVEVNWRLTDAPQGVDWNALREAVSAGPILVRGGSNQSNDAVRHPRSAAGIHEDGRKILLVLVEGRSSDSVGIGLADLADYLIHMGAHEGLNFDGGGSSALAATVNGRNRLLNEPSGSSERYVPTGLGVVFEEEQSLDRSRIWRGANGREMSGLFQNYDAASEKVTLILDGRRYTIPLSSLSQSDQALIRRAHPEE